MGNVVPLHAGNHPVSGLRKLADDIQKNNSSDYCAVITGNGDVFYFGDGDDELAALRAHYLCNVGINFLTRPPRGDNNG